MEHEGFIKLTNVYDVELWVRAKDISAIMRESDSSTGIYAGSTFLVTETSEEIFKKIEEAY